MTDNPLDVVSVPVDRGPNFSDSTLPLSMIEAGAAVFDQVDDDNRNYVAGETTDWDHGMIAVAVYRAMTAAAPPAPVVDREAVADIAAERRRQIEAEGWTPDHDDEHDDGQMANAAGAYAINAGQGWLPNDLAYDEDGEAVTPAKWPWEHRWWKPGGRRRDLVKAGALIVAEIERLDRAALRTSEGGRADDYEGPDNGMHDTEIDDTGADQ